MSSNTRNIFWTTLYIVMIVGILLLRVSLSLFPNFSNFFLIIAIIPFFLLWAKYFYKVFKIETEPVQIKFVRPLNLEEEVYVKNELRNYRDIDKKLILSITVLVFSWSIFFWISLTHMLFFESLLLLLVVIGLISFISFVYFLNKFDKVLVLKNNLKKGIMRIEGKLFVTNMQIVNARNGDIIEDVLLRMGKHTFTADKKLISTISEGSRYAIEYYGGTKQICRIERLTEN